jgi:phosphodiesterase/alkaline phosphatase D-like protein
MDLVAGSRRLGAATFRQSPAIVTRDSQRPSIIQGVQSGDALSNFREFVSGPLHAGVASEPRPTDDTFGTTVMFQRLAKSPLASPYEGMLFFGEVTIEGRPVS